MLNSWTRLNSYQRSFLFLSNNPFRTELLSIFFQQFDRDAYDSHINEKNFVYFVGLTTSADWISGGREDNADYTYYESLSQPVIKFNFESIDMVTVRINCDIHSLLFQIAYRVAHI